MKILVIMKLSCKLQARPPQPGPALPVHMLISSEAQAVSQCTTLDAKSCSGVCRAPVLATVPTLLALNSNPVMLQRSNFSSRDAAQKDGIFTRGPHHILL